MRTKLLKTLASLAPLILTLPCLSASAGTFTANFNSATPPAGLTLFDRAKIVGSGGVGGSGYLSLTDATTNQNGGAIIQDLNSGQAVGGFTARMKLLIGGGTNQPGDGFSLSFGNDLPNGAISEEGAGTGLRIVLDTYDNSAGEAPALDVFYKSNLIAHARFDGTNTVPPPPVIDPATGQTASLQTGTNFVDLLVDLHPNGTLDVVYKGIVVYTNLFINGYAPAAGRFGLGARTSGVTENHWVDDLNITTVAPSTNVASIKVQPVSQTVVEGNSATFSVVPDGAPPFTFEWFKNGSAITNAAGNTLTITNVALTDTGAKYKVKVSNAIAAIDSAEAVLTVTADTSRPAVVSVTGSERFTEATVVFSKPVTAATAGDRANYSFDGGLVVSTATVINPTTVLLKTSRQTPGATYNLKVSNVADTATPPTVIDPNLTKVFAAFAALRGGLRLEAYFDLGGTNVQALIDDPKFPNTAGFSGYVTNFTSRLVLPDSSHENYGGRLSGWLVPAETALYEFFIRSDDASQLLLSPDDNPANAVVIAEELECCGPFEESGAPETSAPVALASGNRYHITALWKAGSGGGYCEVAWRKLGDTTAPSALAAISGAVLEVFAPPGTFAPPVTGGQLTISSTQAGKVVVSWAGTGILQSASDITGPWSDMAGATSPFNVTSTESPKFYRLKP